MLLICVIAAKINDMDFGEDGDEIIFDTKEDADEDIDDVGWCVHIVIFVDVDIFLYNTVSRTENMS